MKIKKPGKCNKCKEIGAYDTLNKDFYCPRCYKWIPKPEEAKVNISKQKTPESRNKNRMKISEMIALLIKEELHIGFYAHSADFTVKLLSRFIIGYDKCNVLLKKNIPIAIYSNKDCCLRVDSRHQFDKKQLLMSRIETETFRKVKISEYNLKEFEGKLDEI